MFRIAKSIRSTGKTPVVKPAQQKRGFYQIVKDINAKRQSSSKLEKRLTIIYLSGMGLFTTGGSLIGFYTTYIGERRQNHSRMHSALVSLIDFWLYGLICSALSPLWPILAPALILDTYEREKNRK